MQIIIKEDNGFMPTTKINIKSDEIIVDENNKQRILKYQKEDIEKILDFLYNLSKGWKDKYIDNKIIDDEKYTINIINKDINREIIIKNKYPDNWSKFILFRNKLLREEL